jgi:hypothetical protein
MLDSIGDGGGALKHNLIRAVRLALEQCRCRRVMLLPHPNVWTTKTKTKQKEKFLLESEKYGD